MGVREGLGGIFPSNKRSVLLLLNPDPLSLFLVGDGCNGTDFCGSTPHPPSTLGQESGTFSDGS